MPQDIESIEKAIQRLTHFCYDASIFPFCFNRKSILFETDINQNFGFIANEVKKVKSGSEKMNSESPEIPGSTTLQDLRRSNKNYGNGLLK